METLDLAILFEADARAAAFEDAASNGDKQAFDGRPFNRPGNRIDENGRQGLALLGIDDPIIVYAST